MNMKLKCIGGELDGYRYEVADYQLIDGELVQLPAPIRRLTMNNDPNEMQTTIECTQLYYKVFTMHFNEKNIRSKQHYLIPIDWSFREAVLYQFGK